MSDFKIISDITRVDKNKWSEFVARHPQGNVFQTPDYYNFCNSIKGYAAIAYFCMIGEEIVGTLVSEIQREFSGFGGVLTGRAIVRGGPLVTGDDPVIFKALIKAFNDGASHHALFGQFRNLRDLSFWSEGFKLAGYNFEDHLDIIIKLTEPKEKLWSDIHPTRRKQINRSERRGVVVNIYDNTDKGKIETCYRLLKKTYRKAGLPLPGQDFFLNASILFNERKIIKLFTAEFNSEIIGFRMVLCYKNLIYDWYAASSDNHLDKYPNDILPWKIICWGKDNNYEFFDFGGAGKPGEPYGVRDYKLKFGGTLVNYGRFTVVYRKFLYNIVMALFSIRKKIIGKR